MSEEQESRAVVEAADRVYAEPVETFVSRRGELVSQVTAEHGKATGQRVAKLRKPSVAAWAVNLLVRREGEQIDQVLALAAQLRAAAEALDGEELRALTRQRRQLTTALATTARRRAKEAGSRLSEPVVEQVEGMLTAAMLDPVAAQVIRTGRVVTAFSSTGMSELDVRGVVACPEALDHQAAPVADEPVARPELRLVEDPGAELREAEEALEEAQTQVRAAEAEQEEVRASVQELDARRLQLQAQAEELRRQLAELDERADDVDDEHEEAAEALAEAEQVLVAAKAEAVQARAEVDRLRE